MKLKLDSEADGVVKVSVSGMVTLTGETKVEPLGDLLGEEPYGKRVLLDMGTAEKIDSSGIGWLVTCHKRFVEGEGKLVIHSVQPFVANVLKVVRLDRFFNIASNERQGLPQLKGEDS